MSYEDSIHSALYLSENIKSYIMSLFKEAVDTFVSKEMCIAPLLYLLQGSNHVHTKCHLLQTFNGAISVAWISFIQQ